MRGTPMVPIKTTVEDIQRVLSYLGKQIGWVEGPKIEKALGSIDDRKIGAMVEFGLILRDGGNLRTTPNGQTFITDPVAALREVLRSVELYRSTLEWVHYGNRTEVTVAEIGQYWESTHKDTLGGVMGSTLREGAITFGRIVDGAGLGSFKIGRAGKETRITFEASAVDVHVNGTPVRNEDEASANGGEGDAASQRDVDPVAALEGGAGSQTALAYSDAQTLPAPSAAPSVSVSTSPSVHVNVEIHIAADATADTVREIFKNMARYVLDKHVTDDGD